MKNSAVIPARPSTSGWSSAGLGSRLRGVPEACWVALLLLGLTVGVLGRTLFSREMLLSSSECDLALQFIHWRKFGFDQLRAGHLALWNPHIYGGAPFFGGFQSALLYPPNWLYLCLPLVVAINVGIALHVFLAGFGMYLWTRHRGLHPLAALFAGVVFMFSGPVFPHIYAGHLSNICAMAWGPFIFLAFDGWLRHRTAGWLLLGAGGLALQILAGHPQYVSYTGVAAALYCAGQLAVARRPVQAGAGLLLMLLTAVGLCAVQLFEGFHAAGESVRNHGTSETFAALFSLPPENFLTLLVPNFFGRLTGDHQYWGRWLLWEMSLFFSVTGLVLAGYALARSPARRRVWGCAALVIALLCLALGGNTPLFPWLYRHAPGFSRFRGWSKFTYPAMLFAVVLAATGFDVLLRDRLRGARLGLIVLGTALILGALSLGMSWSGDESHAAAPQPWGSWIHTLAGTDQQFLSGRDAADPRFAGAAARYAARGTRLAAGTLLALGALLLVSRRYPWALAGVVVLASVESLCFASSWIDQFPIDDVLSAPDAEFLQAQAGSDARVSDVGSHDLAMSLGAHDIWGYDPGVSRRYAEWMTQSQDRDPDEASDAMKLERPVPPAFATLLRLRWTLPQDWSPADGEPTLNDDGTDPNPAPQLMLLTRYRVIPERDDELDAIGEPGFEPTKEVLLESAPLPVPAGGEPAGEVRLVSETTDSLTIEATLSAAAILMITDTYSDGWHARSLLPPPANRAPTHYEVLPADYCMRAISLGPGHHRIFLEYRPLAFVIGKWVSWAALALYGVAFLAWWRAARGSGGAP